MIKERNYKKEYLEYLNIRKEKGEESYILFGTPLHGNIGDQAIVIAEYKFLNDIGINEIFEIYSPEVSVASQDLKEIVSPDAIIMIHGGGFLGNEWLVEEEMAECVIESFPNNKIVILPQTVFFKENAIAEKEKAMRIFNNHKNLTICAREEKSFSLMKEIFYNNNIILIPDIVLYLNEHMNEFTRDGILLCLRHDPEAKITDDHRNLIRDIALKFDNNVVFTDTVIPEKVNMEKRDKVLEGKLDEFAKSKLVVTDRLHGMVFAAITKTPCVVIGNYNHKVEGVYKWIKDLEYIQYINTLDEVEEHVSNLYKMKIDKYNNIDKEIYDELKNELLGK